LFSDASGQDWGGDASLAAKKRKTGFGAVCNGFVYQGSWVKLKKNSSSYAELVPLLLVLQHQGPQLQGQLLLVTTDNLGNAFALNRGASSSKSTKEIMRTIQETALAFNVAIVAQWVSREFNTLCDDLSKWVPDVSITV